MTPLLQSTQCSCPTRASCYARLRNVRFRPASPVGVGALFPAAAAAVVDTAVFFTFAGACVRAAAGFLAVAAAPAPAPAVAFRAPVPVLVGRTTVVPEEALDETLFLRSTCRVAGRGRGDRAPFEAAGPALLPGRDDCDAYLPWVAVDVAALAPLFTELFARSGLDGFRGDTGFDRYPDCWDRSANPRNGDCGYVREFCDLGDRILDSAPRTSCETIRDAPPVPTALPRFFGLLNASIESPAATAFSLSE